MKISRGQISSQVLRGIRLSVVLLMGGSIVAQAAGPGTSGGDILNIPVGARAIAMGEAFTALADDASSLYWNPAGLALLNQSQASFLYNQHLQGTTLSQGAVATPLENGGLGASLSYLSFGTIKGYDLSGAPTADVSAYSGVATVGGALLGDFWSLGMNMKGIQGSLADVKATGFATDLGLNLIYPQEVLGTGTLRFGATLRNLGTGLKYIQERDPFPTEVRVGVAALQLLNRKLTLSADFGKARDNQSSLYAGGEFWLVPFIALRAGYAGNHTESSGLRAGMGLRIKDVSFDYAYSQFGDLGMTNRYEMNIRFGAIRPLLTPEERRILRRGKQAMNQGRYGEAVMLFDSLIQLVPKYKPAQRLAKLAMKGDESQEKEMRNAKKFQTGLVTNTKAAAELSDLNDLENLLELSESPNATAKMGDAKPAKKGQP